MEVFLNTAVYEYRFGCSCSNSIPLGHKKIAGSVSGAKSCTRAGFQLQRPFTVEDTCNMDESPLVLFSDQAKRSMNDIGTSNEINGCLSNKVIYYIMFD